jgi:hypothetical protein
MFDELNKYKTNDHFFFNPTDSLDEVCNAPDDKDGVYLVYELKNGNVNMVYIGTSGIRVSGYLKDGLFGLKKSIINGVPSENEKPSQSWPVKMLSENIDALDIYWYVTYKGNLKDHPESLQSMLLYKYLAIYGEFPPWNKPLKRSKKSP